MSKKKVLVVEDDRPLAEALAYNLQRSGFDVTLATDGREAVNMSRVAFHDVVLLDLMLPELDGLEVCRRMRSHASTRDSLVIMLTAKAEEVDQLIGFSVGADDYVTKPFSVKVLLQRIKALLRRQEGPVNDSDVIVSQGLMIDRLSHRATIGDQPMTLTKSEFALLEVLARHQGRAFSRAELIDAALGDDAIVLERTIDVHIRAVRKKLGQYANLVETVRGVGYRFRDPRSELATPEQNQETGAIQ